MPSENVPDDFDWVNAQAKCSAASMFERLRTRVKEDVQRRNGLFNRNDGWKFDYQEDVDAFEVSRLVALESTRPEVAAVVRFERAGRHITVRSEDVDVDFSAIVTTDATGACRFVVGETVYSEWEVGKMALELLFFEEPDEAE